MRQDVKMLFLALFFGIYIISAWWSIEMFFSYRPIDTVDIILHVAGAIISLVYGFFGSILLWILVIS